MQQSSSAAAVLKPAAATLPPGTPPAVIGAATPSKARPKKLAASVKSIATDQDVVAPKPKPVDLERPLVDFEIGPELGMRDFRYGQVSSTGLRPYSNAGIVMGSASVAVFPFAESRMAVARDIGFVASAGSSFLMNSTGAQTGKSVNGSWTRYDVGARARIHLGEPPRAPWLGIEGTYGDSRFTFSGDDPSVVDAPSVDYQYIRGGADLTVPLGRLSLLTGAGFRHFMMGGQIAERFPRATANGFDGHLGAAYRINRTFDVRGTAEYVAALIDPNARTGDKFIAGRALDQSAIVQLGVSAFLF
jgi:hypothetical protein